MSEAAGQEKTLTLSEQWSLQEESSENVTSVGTTENASTEEITDGANSKATAIDVSSTEEREDLNIHAASLEESITDKADETSPVEGTTETIVQEMTEEEETSEAKPVIKLETAPADFRFPTTNQTRHCFTRYVEYHRCINAKGEGDPGCEKFAKYYRSLCPSEWVERWNEQRENGTFPGPL